MEVCLGRLPCGHDRGELAVAQWTHSILGEHDFVSEWKASTDALDLQLQVQQETGFQDRNWCSASHEPCSKKVSLSKTKVNFNKTVELYVGCERGLQVWNHVLGSPIAKAKIFQPLQVPLSDEVSFMSAPATPDQGVPAVHQEQQHNIMEDRGIARDQDSESSSSADEDSLCPDQREPDWFASLLFAVDFQTCPLRVNWNDYESMHDDAARLLAIPRDHLFYLHHVRSAPQDLVDAGVEALIGQRHNDLMPGSTLQLILLDVEFHSALPDIQPEVVRRIVKLPRTIGRLSILNRLGLGEYCRRTRQQCIVWHNGNMISWHTARPLAMAHGDYLRIAVPPGEESVQHIATRCLVTASMQGISDRELCDRHALYVLGWYDTIIGPPIAPVPPDADDFTLLQLAPDVPSPEQKPWFLLAKPNCRICDPEPLDHFEDDCEEITREFVTRARPNPPGGVLPDRALDEQPEYVHNLLGQLEEHGLTEVEEEGQILYVSTWHLNHPHDAVCRESRTARLTADFTQWNEQLLTIWRDRLEEGQAVEFLLVFPQPPATRMQPNFLPHIILMQRYPEGRRAAIISTIDARQPADNYHHMATFLPMHVSKDDVILLAERAGACYPQISELQCMVWHGDQQLRDVQQIVIHHGISFLLIIQDVSFMTMNAWDETEEGAVNLLQTDRRLLNPNAPIFMSQLPPDMHKKADAKVSLQLDALIPPSCERLTHGSVAHTHGPRWDSDAWTATQSQDQAQGITAVKLYDLACLGTLPQYVELPEPITSEQVQQELRYWGHDLEVFDCWPQELFACCPRDRDEGHIHYLFCRLEKEEPDQVFAHTNLGRMTEHEMLCFLCHLDFPRAVILQATELATGWQKIIFSHQEPQIASLKKQKTPGIWPPPPQTTKPQHQPLFKFECVTELQGPCQLTTAIKQQDLKKLFDSTQNMLCRDFTCFDLPEFVQKEMQPFNSEDPMPPLANFDRILIFTDGTSSPDMRRLPPEQADDVGRPDAWAFLVVGELYGNGAQRFQPLGWSSQVVRYDQEGSHYNGVQKIGSDYAERSALTWSALWRLAQNVDVATLFCTDSLVSGAQAFGQMGAGDLDESFCIMRGVFQALQVSMPADQLGWHHIKSHTGMVFNEFVDLAAKWEVTHGFHLPRQAITMATWRTAIPYLWMIFAGPRWGLPQWQEGGFAIPPPARPTLEERHQQGPTRRSRRRKVDFAVSLATANVHSLARAPDGHAGKLHYLFQQMRSFKLNIIGIQEARTDQGVACSQNILRISSGNQDKQLGVELWIDLEMPVGHDHKGRPFHLHRGEVQVVHADARRLLVRLDNPVWTAWFLVLHAPHSGHPLSHREEWWHTTHELILQHHDGDPLFVMMDANAPPGEEDGRIVFDGTFATAKNTTFLRQFLQAHCLCLPATSTTCHQGDTGTWLDLAGEHWHCIDHIAVPQDWMPACKFSKVLDDYDLATSIEDHRAVALQLQWSDTHEELVPGTRPKKSRRTDFKDERVTEALCQFRPAPWHTDIEQHMEQFNHALHQTIARPNPGQDSLEVAKKPYITEEVWAMRKEKLGHRATLKLLNKRISREVMSRCFYAWSAKGRRSTEEDSYLVSLQCWRLKHWIAFKRKAQQMRVRLIQAKQLHLSATLSSMDSKTPASDIIRSLKQYIGPTNPKKIKQKTIPMVQNENGQPCVYPAEALGVWINYFMQMEGGTRITPEDLRTQWIEELATFAHKDLILDIQELPTLTELEVSFRRVPSGRALGPDNIPGELCRQQPAPLALASFASLAKLFCHGQEYLGHKGGQLTPAYKGKGPTSSCSSYRSLLVSSNIGKVLHRTVRQATATLYESFMQTQQVGGRRRVPVQLALHEVRAFMRKTRRCKRSAGILFLDLTEAFYRILRELSIGGAPTDETVARVMQRLKMPAHALHEIHALLQETPALQQAGLSATARNCIAAIHSGTHFWLKDQHDVAKTCMGTRPGDSFADVIFGYSWSLVLRKLEGYMVEHNLVEPLQRQTNVPLFNSQVPSGTEGDYVYIGPTWMDDLALCVEGVTPHQLESRIGQATGCLLDLCSQHLMSPNLAKGKTEMLLVFRGAKSKELKEKHYGMSATKQFPIISEQGMCHIQLVKSYKHLGGWLHHRTDQRMELAQKAAVAHAAFGRHRKLLYTNSSLGFDKRTEMFTALVMTKFMYGADSWSFDTKKDACKFRTTVLKLYKRLLKWTPDQQLTEDAIIAASGLPAPEELLRRARLRYLVVLCNCGIPDIWSLLQLDYEWCQQLEQDLLWMWEQLKTCSSLGDPRDHFPQWLLLLQDHRSYWKRLVNRACQHAILQRQKVANVCQLHHEVCARIAEVINIEVPLAQEEIVVAPTQETYGCLTCQIACRSKAGEGAHMFRAHGLRAQSRQWFDEPSCPACLRFFHTMAKTKAHLYYSARCRAQLISRNMRCDIMAGVGSLEDQEREMQHDFLLPPSQGYGPMQQEQRPRDPVLIDDELHMHVVECIDAGMPLPAVRDALTNYATEHPISWSLWTATLLFIVDTFGEEDAAFFQYDLTELRAVMVTLTTPATWPFFAQRRGGGPDTHQPRSIPECHERCHQMIEMAGQQVVSGQAVPRQFGRHRYILHAFSGRRRMGDLQYFLEKAISSQKAYVLHTISLDIIVEGTWGNVALKSTRSFWLRAIKDRWVVAFLGGPPCETWSRVRAVGHSTVGTIKPRVLRNLDFLWGFESAAIRELRQLLTGNTLLGFSLAAMVELAATGGYGIVEHPGEPEDLPQAASIWRLPLLLLMMQLPGMQRCRLAQGMLGAPTPKPTDLLTLNLDDVMIQLHRHKIRKELPRARAVGQTSEGHWKTSVLKEYPPAMCQALACTFIEALDRCPIDPDAPEPPPCFMECCAKMECTEYSTVLGHDFAG